MPHLACSPQFVLAPRRENYLCKAGVFSVFVAAVPNMRKRDVTAPSPRARGGGKGMCAVGSIILATCVPVIGA